MGSTGDLLDGDNATIIGVPVLPILSLMLVEEQQTLF